MNKNYEKGIIALITLVFFAYCSWNYLSNGVDLSNYSVVSFMLLFFALSRYKKNK